MCDGKLQRIAAVNRVVGRILLHETGAGIPNLIVTLYDVDRDSLPDEGTQSSPFARVVTYWDRLQGNRLGSVLTDRNGRFELEYADKEFGEQRPDLLLFVTAPEGPGLEGCSPILHLSCGIRQNAGRLESYLIRLTAKELSKAGIPLPTTEMRDDGVSKGRADREKYRNERQKTLDRVRVTWRHEAPAPKLSDLFRRNLQIIKTARDRIPENGFRLGLPVIGAQGQASAGLSFDRESKRWSVHRETTRTELRFGGIVATTDLAPQLRPATGMGVIVDEESQEFRIAVSPAPVSLRAEESSPGNLFISTLKQRRRRAAKRLRPSDASGPSDGRDDS